MTELGRARAATLAVFFVNGLGIGAWSAAIPPLKLAFALSDGRLSLILLAFAGGAVLFMPIGGAVAPRWAPTGVTTSGPRSRSPFPLRCHCSLRTRWRSPWPRSAWELRTVCSTSR